MNKKSILTIVFTLLACTGLLVANFSQGGLVSVSPFIRVDTDILPKVSTHHLGNTSNRIAKIWATAFDVSGAFTLGGTVGSGGIDMANTALTNASYIQGVYINATGTVGVATSTLQGALVVATSTALSSYELTVWGDIAIGTNMTPAFTVSTAGAVVAASYGGITEANLLDKSASETITGIYTLATTTVTGGDFTVDGGTLYIDADNGRVGFATTSPSTDYVFYHATGTTTAAFLSGGSGYGSELQIQAPNGNCYSITCDGVNPAGCGWATSTCNQ